MEKKENYEFSETGKSESKMLKEEDYQETLLGREMGVSEIKKKNETGKNDREENDHQAREEESNLILEGSKKEKEVTEKNSF